FLYFYDEAVSFAAGHRPCAECRRPSYEAYRAAWAQGLGVEPPSAREINRRLHGERIFGGSHRRPFHALARAGLPDCALVLLQGTPPLVLGADLVEWTTEGYGAGRRRPRRGTATVITPPSTLAALRAGYPVQIADGARR